MQDTPLHYAASVGSMEVVKILLNADANLFAKDSVCFLFWDFILLFVYFYLFS
jgi:ankyrin repeat protein